MNKQHVVCIGGGSGLPIWIYAIKDIAHVSALVPSSDSGGGGIIVAQAFDMPASSDAERCAMALGHMSPEVEMLLSVRYETRDFRFPHDIRASNFACAAYYQKLRDYQKAIDMLCRLCNVNEGSEVIPMTKERVQIRAYYENGKIINEEHEIDDPNTDWQRTNSIQKVEVLGDAQINPRAAEAFKRADKIIISFGSLGTSILAALAVSGATESIIKASRRGAEIIYFVNTMTEPGQTGSLLTASSHVKLLEAHLGKGIFSKVVIHHDGQISEETLRRYNRDGAAVVIDDLDEYLPKNQIIRANLLSDSIDEVGYRATTKDKVQNIEYIRHDVARLQDLGRMLLM